MYNSWKVPLCLSQPTPLVILCFITFAILCWTLEPGFSSKATKNVLLKKLDSWDFHGGPVVKTLCS